MDREPAHDVRIRANNALEALDVLMSGLSDGGWKVVPDFANGTVFAPELMHIYVIDGREAAGLQ